MVTIITDYFIAEGKPGHTSDGRVYNTNWEIFESIYGDDDKKTAKGELFANGFVKWDGCSNWTFHTKDCMFHSCTKEMLTDIGIVLAKCWEESAKLMPDTWGS